MIFFIFFVVNSRKKLKPGSLPAYLCSNFEDVTSKIKSLQLSKLKHWLVTLNNITIMSLLKISVKIHSNNNYNIINY